jgi:hypothetical protein
LLGVEAATGKGEKDWHSLKDPTRRATYIEELLGLPALVGRVFYGGVDSLHSDDYWRVRVDVLSAAIQRYSHRHRCYHEVAHEGLTGRPRDQLLADLRRRGVKRISVEPANIDRDPETRCADALAGYIRLKLFDQSESSKLLPDLPNWLVNCRP